MLEKIKAFYRVFTIGQSVANPAAWKLGKITGDMVAALLSALVVLARAFGYDLHISDSDLLQLGGSVVILYAAISSASTVASTTVIGLPPLKQDRPSDIGLSSIPTDPTTAVPPIGSAHNGDDITGSTPQSRI